MKRSVMLTRLTNIIHTHRRATEGVTSVELAQMVLSVVEEGGMLPPCYPKAHDYPGVDSYHVWEKENE